MDDFLNEFALYKFYESSGDLCDKYTYKLNDYTKLQLYCASFVYSYMRFNVKKKIYKNEFEEEMERNFNLICDYIGANKAENDLESVMKQVEEIAQPVLLQLNNLKKELKLLYMENNRFLFHISKCEFENIQAFPGVNMYKNQFDKFIFATSSNTEIYLYICRSCGENMCCINNQVIFLKNPFMQINNDEIYLNCDVYIYKLPAEFFEPIIDFSVTEGKGQIKFGHEWVSVYENMAMEKIFVSGFSRNKLNGKIIYSLNNKEYGIDIFDKLDEVSDKVGLIRKLLLKNIIIRVM